MPVGARRVFLMRHGLPEPPNSLRFPDGDRALSERGADDVRRVVSTLRSRLIPLRRILHSPLRRTTETALIVADELGAQAPLLENENLLAQDLSRTEYERRLPLLLNQDGVLLVGHEPSLRLILSILAEISPHSYLFEPGTVAQLLVWESESHLQGQLVQLTTAL